MSSRSFNLSSEILVFLKAKAAKHGGNQSAALEEIMQAYRLNEPDIKKQSALNDLRQGASILHDIEMADEAILAFVKIAIGKR